MPPSSPSAPFAPAPPAPPTPPAPPVVIRARVESEPGRRTEREELGPRATLWLDPLTDDTQGFALSVARGLSTRPRRLDCRYLYDEIGSELFAEITRQPEYYLTRAEAEILACHADELARGLGAIPICELGSGTADKTRLLLAAWAREARGEFHYVPVDIDPGVLRAAAAALCEAHPALRVSALATSYENALERLRDVTPKLVLFLGSSIGNFEPPELDKFLHQVESALQPGDAFLLGVDLVKEAAALEAAYNDAAGVTAAFNLNLLARINRELAGTFDLAAFRHEAVYNPREGRIEMHLLATRAQEVAVRGRRFRFREGESIHTENSYKYSIDQFRDFARSAGWEPQRVWTDERALFSVHELVS